MSTLSASKAEALERAKKFDYVRFTVADFNGIPRSRVIPKAGLEKAWEEGVGVFAGKTSFLGSDSPGVIKEYKTLLSTLKY